MQNIGSLVHFSIPSSHVFRAVDFYGKLFGWKFRKMTETYWLAEDGIGSISYEKEPISGTMPILFFSVSNLDESLNFATSLGATTLVGRSDAGDGKSFFATFRDLDGNVIGIWSKL